jgi:hypothetical protein
MIYRGGPALFVSVTWECYHYLGMYLNLSCAFGSLVRLAPAMITAAEEPWQHAHPYAPRISFLSHTRATAVGCSTGSNYIRYSITG